MVWPNTNSCRPNPGGESQESAEFQRQMEELRQRERAAVRRQVSQFIFIIFFCFKNFCAKNNKSNLLFQQQAREKLEKMEMDRRNQRDRDFGRKNGSYDADKN